MPSPPGGRRQHRTSGFRPTRGRATVERRRQPAEASSPELALALGPRSGDSVGGRGDQPVATSSTWRRSHGWALATLPVSRRRFLATGALAAAGTPLLGRAPVASAQGRAAPRRYWTSRPAPTSPRPSRRARSSTTATTASPASPSYSTRSRRTSRRSRPATCGCRPARSTRRSPPSGRPGASASTCSSSPTSRRPSTSRRRAAGSSTRSPEYAAYKPEYQSTPAGYYGCARRRASPASPTTAPR